MLRHCPASLLLGGQVSEGPRQPQVFGSVLGGRLGSVAVHRHPFILPWVCVLCGWLRVVSGFVLLVVALSIKRGESLFRYETAH